MANIKIKSRWDLGSYGTNIKNFSDAYTVETNSLYRNFTDKAGSDSKGEAVNAYFKKLNVLQDQVFAQLPSAIKDYGNVVITYAETIEDAGFQDECFSSDSGASSLEELLKGEQVKQISDVSEALNQAFKQASEAMGTSAEDTSKICETATSDLTDAGAKRVKKDKEVQDAYSTFTSKLTTATTNISNFQNVLNNALYLAEIPSSTIFRAIANGNLTAEQMYYLDVPRTKEDAQALKAIISDKPGDVLKVDPNKISEQMYAVIASEQNDWTMTNNNKMWQHFVNALGEYSVERNGIFTNGILKAEDALAQILMSQMYQLYENKPTPDLEEYEELMKQYQMMYDSYQSELNAINSNTGLMYSLQVLEIGTSKVSKVIESERTMEQYRYKKVASVELKNGQFEIKTDKGEHKSKVNSVQSYYKDKDLKLIDKDYNWNEHKEYTATTEFSDFGMQASKYSERLKKLQEERQEAHDKFSESILSAIAETGISFIPFGSTALSVVKTLGAVSDGFKGNEFQSNGTSAIKSARDDYKSFYKKTTGQDIPDTKFDKYWGHWSKLSSGISDGVKALNTYNSAISRIDNETSEAKDDMMQKILDHGGWDLSENGKSTIANGRVGQYYDFNAILRVEELNSSGLKGYINNATNLTENDLDAAINKTFTEEKDKQTYSAVIAYVRGEKPDLKLEDMKADQLEKFTTIVKNLGRDGMSGLGDYFDKEYQMEEVKPYGAK
ncbi:hypothetical protein HMPREF3108_09865 [Streptococcus sp. HMSC10A01]|uniref:hypothetical protein n=1 Tax=Streptococcus sp. HMSC10A01 TaxID=1581076 RepID=UPI0008A628F7|nr:hypothetical protein [Streptococcus sp. HMSC10A01]OFU69532.1 hypothetical protein HMPREF3108_09865 [Streptococcus sp. HMSC10A01]